MPTAEPTVRFAVHAQQWLDAYLAARPRWDSPPEGPAHWQVVSEVDHAVRAEPTQSRDTIIDVVAHTTGAGAAQVTAAIAYWVAHPDQVDAQRRS